MCKNVKECKRLWMNKFVHGFWVSYGLIKVKVSESSTPCTITHNVHLKTVFPGNPLLKDISKECCVIIITIITITIIIIIIIIIILFPIN